MLDFMSNYILYRYCIGLKLAFEMSFLIFLFDFGYFLLLGYMSNYIIQALYLFKISFWDALFDFRFDFGYLLKS